MLIEWLWEWNTHAYRRHPRIFKNFSKFSKSNSQRIGPKVWYPQNQHDLLNHFQFFQIKKSPIEKRSVDLKSRNSTYVCRENTAIIFIRNDFSSLSTLSQAQWYKILMFEWPWKIKVFYLWRFSLSCNIDFKREFWL